MLEQDKRGLLKKAEILERVGRYEESASTYETLGRVLNDGNLYDKARELRDKARGSQLKIVSVDINKMISQFKENGVTIAYTCPKCGAGLNIDDEKKLDNCNYCGSKIEKINLREMLQAAL